MTITPAWTPVRDQLQGRGSGRVLVSTVRNGLAGLRDILAGAGRGVTGAKERRGAQEREQGQSEHRRFFEHGLDLNHNAVP